MARLSSPKIQKISTINRRETNQVQTSYLRADMLHVTNC